MKTDLIQLSKTRRGFFGKHTEETKLKMRLAKLGKTSPHKGETNRYSPETLEKMRQAKLGTKQSKETIEKRVSKYRGRKDTPEMRLKKSLASKGKKKSPEHIAHMSGANAHNWKGGIYPEHLKIRKSPEMKLWKMAVFARDNYTCVWCGQKSGKIEADHIKSFSEYPELRFAIDNGRTLCRECHQKTDTYGWKLYHNKK